MRNAYRLEPFSARSIEHELGRDPVCTKILRVTLIVDIAATSGPWFNNGNAAESLWQASFTQVGMGSPEESSTWELDDRINVLNVEGEPSVQT